MACLYLAEEPRLAEKDCEHRPRKGAAAFPVRGAEPRRAPHKRSHRAGFRSSEATRPASRENTSLRTKAAPEQPSGWIRLPLSQISFAFI